MKRHNVLTEIFTITEKSALLYKSQIFDQPQPNQASSSDTNFLQINNAWNNLKYRDRHFFKNIQFFRYWKSKKISDYYMHTLIQESISLVFKHFSVSPAACMINIYLEHSFYIPISTLGKGILFFFFQFLVKKIKHPLILIHFGKRLQDKQWLGVGLGRCDRDSSG